MNAEKLRDVLHATPFRPFVIHLADGRQCRVRHPDFLAISPTGRTVIVYHDNDAHSILDLLLVTELAIEASPSPKDGAA